jgi:hypothetical protein
LLQIVEELGPLMSPKDQQEICDSLTNGTYMAICYALLRSDPSECDQIRGEGAALERELCIGSVAEITCFRLTDVPERDACLYEIAVTHDGFLACASISDANYAMRQECYALATKDASYCDRIADPERRQACYDSVSGKATTGADDASSATPAPTAGVADPAKAGQTWTGTFPDYPGSSITFTVTADGKLTGSGVVPNAISGATATITVGKSSAGSSEWRGDMEMKTEGGTVNFDAMSALQWDEEPDWTVKIVGGRLVGHIENFGDFVLDPQ